ncbi:MAG TPA: TlpA disulfide reductase family protein [Thermoanaerobaculia bacterium]|jgi:thiol-disulfide isomerase/thioredoxin|nr:TlpA disulfide reductase family protein [Thermoanaerobaculia bacterium]
MKSTLATLCAVILGAACAKHETQSVNPAKPATTASSSTSTAARTAKEEPELASARTDVGDPMPPYTATYLDGKPLNLANEKGSVIFLNVWATWCGPCRFETPELQALQNQYAANGLKVIGVSVDEGETAAVKTFVTEQKITYPIAVDPEGRIANLLQTTVLPTSLLLDRNGKIVWRQIGAIMPNDTKLKAAVEKAIAEKK